MTIRALLIDDDVRLAELLAEYLGPHDVILLHAPDGARGLAVLDGGGVEVVLLDGMLPGLDGLDVLRRIRLKSAVPILMLTARGDETDRVVGLELGADDYLAKPASPRELLARVRAVLRRTAPREVDAVVRVADLEVDPGARVAKIGGEALPLTSLEFDLLLALARKAGRVIDRDGLWDLAGRGDTAVGDRTVDVHVSRLRAKLGDDAREPRRLRTVRGSGYILVKEPG